MGEGGQTYVIHAFFENTGGVMEGNPIRMVGKAIGQVDNIQLDPEKRGVKMNLSIDKEIKIPKDSILKIAEKGMLGEMYLSFSFGSSKDFYQEGDLVVGHPPKGLMDFMGSAEGGFKEGIDSFKEVAEELKKVLAGVNDVLSKDGTKEQLSNTIKALPAAMKEMTELFKENKTAMKDVLLKMKEIGGEGGSALKKVNEMLAELKEGDTIEDLKQTLAQTKALTGNLNEGLEQQKIMEKLSSTLQSFDQLGQTLSSSANQLGPILGSFEAGQNGTISKLLHDPSLHLKIEEFLVVTTALVTLLEEQPSSIIWGKKRRKKTEEDKD
jgi:phospholipid/cholesterol/gamma-HCH transport system substrate-binding protein